MDFQTLSIDELVGVRFSLLDEAISDEVLQFSVGFVDMLCNVLLLDSEVVLSRHVLGVNNIVASNVEVGQTDFVLAFKCRRYFIVTVGSSQLDFARTLKELDHCVIAFRNIDLINSFSRSHESAVRN